MQLNGSPRAANISAVERETGISKDTLRIWERRYGFPRPIRDAHGERLYPLEQVQRLRIVRRLIDGGLRPGKLLRATESELLARLDALREAASAAAAVPDFVATLIGLLRRHELGALQAQLSAALLRLGVQRFVSEVAAPMTVSVGTLWSEGSMSVAEEHLYTEQMQHILRGAMRDDGSGKGPRVLLTTLPGEEHALGLLMAQAWLCADGAACIPLGTQTPAGDLATVATAQRADVVGLSFSSHQNAHSARAQLAELRTRLDPRIEIWAGGALWQGAHKSLPGVQMVPTWERLIAALADWRMRHAAPAE